ncbi:hypothetical protein MHYP_G00192130 [Metynnis hypsauchen]
MQQIDSRDAVIRCLIHFLGESTEELIKDYQDVSKDVIEQDIKDSVIKILVLGNAAEGAPPTDVIIVIDGTEMGSDGRFYLKYLCTSFKRTRYICTILQTTPEMRYKRF